jgi:FtsH-binding integral membrane protein
MMLSEIIAKSRRQTKLSKFKHIPENQGKNMVISNLIPFTRLNLISAFGCFINAIIRVVQRTQIGFPNLSILIVVMLICLLFYNSEAKKQCKRRSATLRWMDRVFNCQPKLKPENKSTNHHRVMIQYKLICQYQYI